LSTGGDGAPVKTVLVTGGCGFIGSHFVRFLLQRTDWRIVNLDRLTYAGHQENLSEVAEGPRYRFAKGDIADRTLVDALVHDEKPWGIVNFAAESHVDRSILDPTPFLRTNISGVQVLLESARRHALKRFLQISSDEVYGDSSTSESFDEESVLTPSSPYAASKAAADLLCLAYRRTYGLPVLIVRSSNNYGPYQFPEKLIPLVIRNVLAGKALPVYGDGLQQRDWLYVEDNVEAIFAVLERGRAGSIYNVATGEEHTNLEMVQTLCRLLGENTPSDPAELLSRIHHIADRPGHDRRYALNARRIREELSWVPRVPFNVGLDRTVRWYLRYQDWINRILSDEYESYYESVYLRSWERSPGMLTESSR
jgi:dTDP-glucose 4,6-dehydratase